MTRAALIAATVFVLFFAAPAGAQSNVTIHGIVYNELKVPVANATVEFIAPDTGQRITFATNASGRFVADLPAGEYRIRAYVPNATGELWHERVQGFVQSNTYARPLALNRTEPYLPRAPTFSPTNNLNQTGNTTTRGVDVLVRVPLQYLGPGNNKTVRAEADVRAINGTLISQAILGNTTLRAGRAGWLNATLLPAPSDPYHAREQRLLLAIRLYDHDNGTLLDTIERVPLNVQDECTGANVAVTIELLGTPRRALCASPSDETKWGAWAQQARQLQALDADWASRVASNATGNGATKAVAFWSSYEQATKGLRTPVIARLDAAQTDAVGQPRWGELQALRAIVDADRARIRVAIAENVEAHLDEVEAAEDRERMRAGLTFLGASVVMFGAGAGGALAIVRGWKRRTEYWIGYSAKSQARNPVTWLALAGTICLVLGVLIAFAIGGFEWLGALRGGA